MIDPVDQTGTEHHTEQEKIATIWSHWNSDVTDNVLGIIFQYAHEMMHLQIVDFRISWIEGDKAEKYAPPIFTLFWFTA